MKRNRLSAYSLKWNPFSPQIPVEGLRLTPAIDQFGWRIENLSREGGYALATGEPGTGKSVALRLLEDRLSRVRDLEVGVLTRPQSGLADFYREMGELFGVELKPHNRWAGTRALRERWLAHLDASLHRPVLIIDEAQEMQSAVLNELRLMASVALDSRLLLTVVLAGDNRLPRRLRHDELRPLQSRIRVRLSLEPMDKDELAETLCHVLATAGNASLISDPLITTLAEHAAGNYRSLMVMANSLLETAMQRELSQLDEKLFLELFGAPPAKRKAGAAQRSRRRGS